MFHIIGVWKGKRQIDYLSLHVLCVKNVWHFNVYHVANVMCVFRQMR